MNPSFEQYIGIDYSGAQTPSSSLKGLRVYAADRPIAPKEVQPPASPRKYWTRKEIAEWLVERLSEDCRRSSASTTVFHFRLHTSSSMDCRSTGRPSLTISSTTGRPTRTSTSISSVTASPETVRPGQAIPRWRRVTELRARTAKSVFQFDVQGSVAKSTHAGIPWLRYITATR